MLQLEFDTMNFTHLYALYRWNFLSSLLIKCWCHFWTMLDMQLHSCSNLAHVHGYNSDSFRDCVVSLCVFSFLLFLYRQCRYCFYSQAKNQVFRPAGATRCTNSGQTWVRLTVQNFMSIGAEGWEYGPQNIKNFHFLVNCHPARATPLTDFEKF